MSPRGGRRPNQTGRPLRGAEPVTTRATVGLTASERAVITAALRPGESLAGLLRDGGVRLARERQTELTSDERELMKEWCRDG